MADDIAAECVVVATQEAHRGCELLVREGEADRRIADVRMHLAALGEGLALDPGDNVAAVFVDAEPPRRGVETGALQMDENVPR